MHIFKIITPSERTETKTEVTRWVVKSDINDTTWDDLICKLQALFNTRSTQFFISWFDGTDYCTIRDHKELQDAVEFFSEQGAADKAVRIYASPDKREHHTIFGVKPDEDDAVSVMEAPATEASEQEGNDLLNEETDHLGETLSEHSVSEKPEDSEPEEMTTLPAPVEPESLPVQPTGVQQPVTIPMVAYPQYPVNPYMQYITPYGYPPVITPQWPTTCDPSLREQTLAQQAYVAGATAPPLNEQRNTLIAEADNNDPDVAMQQAIRALSITPSINAEPPITNKSLSQSVSPHPMNKPSDEEHGKKSKSKGRAKYVQMSLQTLREMGFTQDERELKKLIKSNNGNLNKIIDILQKQTS
ncbi:hypothetical protein EG68_03446 [Paragonimus skrjabini miyazakii]|uniref:UBA domain-containing protein n=1 Tax=Paragonimus skrjabini miyazakii TaxID=59628 RepID=A0A8S9Z1Y2_9TREM|nr:hypothetical protein EG68_03446 [Paragonimus skrjabini miyazakii]